MSMKAIAVLAGAVLMVGVAIWAGRPAYRYLLALRLLHAADAAARRHEDTEAARFYVLAFEKDARNPKTLRRAATYFERTHNGLLLLVRQQIHRLEPLNADALLDYGEAALVFHQPQLARYLLADEAPAGVRNSARYYHLVSVAHFLADEFPQADAACAEALQRDPGNKVYRVNQASIRINSSDSQVRQASRSVLYDFYSDRDEHAPVLHALLLDASRAPQAELGQGNVDPLLSDGRKSISPADTFYTEYLSALRRWHADEFPARLDAYLKCAVQREDSSLAAQRWLAASGLHAEELAFRASLPPASQNAPESLLDAAEAMFQLQQIERLEAFLREDPWSHCQAFAQAWAARLQRGARPAQARSLTPESTWTKALGSAGNAGEILTLSRLARDWGWTPEYEQTLWLLVDKDPRFSSDALEELGRYYLARGNAVDLLRVLRRQWRLRPEDPLIVNNLAYVSSLLGRPTDGTAELVGKLCARHPDNVAYAATRAFGLLRAGDLAGALKMFDKFDTVQLRGTPQGVTYGLVLAANHDSRAGDFLKDADRLIHFPEERQLIAASKR